MYVVVGLGNPGIEYEKTRHNIGFNAIDYIAEDLNIKVNKSKFKGLYGESYIENEKIILLKPQTFMNSSGISVREIADFYKVDIKKLIIIYDDISIPLGKIRIRPSGSAGGHNGVKSIIYQLSSDEFPRIRIGIGAPDNNLINYVIGNFSNTEEKIVFDMLKIAKEAVYSLISYGVQTSMNKYNCYNHTGIVKKDE